MSLTRTEPDMAPTGVWCKKTYGSFEYLGPDKQRGRLTFVFKNRG